jgi:hypothetical protein
MIEIWEDIKKYEGIYQVSNFGRVKHLAFSRVNVLTNGFSLIKEKILKPVKHENGYLFVSLCNGNQKEYSIHTLVARAFIANPDNKPEVNHKDGIKSNNLTNNLEWNTASENLIHSYKTGLRQSGENHHKAKLKLSQVKEIRRLSKSGISSYRLAKDFNIRACSVRDIINGKTWKYAV